MPFSLLICICTTFAVFALLLPFLAISGCLAYKMIKDIDRQRAKEERKAKVVNKLKERAKKKNKPKQS